MPVHELTLESLGTLDNGRLAAALRRHLKRVADDCYDRPGDAKARKVSLVFSVTPVLEPQGGSEHVKIQFHITSDVPKHRSAEYTMGLKPSGSIVFNADDPLNYQHPTMFEALGDDGEPLPPAQAE